MSTLSLPSSLEAHVIFERGCDDDDDDDDIHDKDDNDVDSSSSSSRRGHPAKLLERFQDHFKDNTWTIAVPENDSEYWNFDCTDDDNEDGNDKDHHKPLYQPAWETDEGIAFLSMDPSSSSSSSSDNSCSQDSTSSDVSKYILEAERFDVFKKFKLIEKYDNSGDTLIGYVLPDDLFREVQDFINKDKAFRVTAVAAKTPKSSSKVDFDDQFRWILDDHYGKFFQYEDAWQLNSSSNTSNSTTVNSLTQQKQPYMSFQCSASYGMIDGHYMKHATVSSVNKMAPVSFLHYMFGKHCIMLRKTMSPQELRGRLSTVWCDQHATRQIVTRRRHKRGGGNYTGGNNTFIAKEADVMDLCYVEVAGNGFTPRLSIGDFLQRIADFQALSPRKCVDRLQLLSSEPYLFGKRKLPGMFFMPASDISIAKESDGNDGCGIIDQQYLINLLLTRGMTKIGAQKVYAIQVRIVCPSKGIFKGMLAATTSAAGRHRYSAQSSSFRSAPIQLDPTQMKVGPSPNASTDSSIASAALIITKTGMYPAKNHVTMHKIVNGEKVAKDSAYRLCASPMKGVIPVLKAVGLSQDEVDEFLKKRKECPEKTLKDRWVVGLTDPTGGEIPPLHIYVTGIQNLWKNSNKDAENIFITRSPAMKVENGRLIQTLVTKPSTMSQANWDFLQGLPLGFVIFALPESDMPPIPSLISNGDLDGDWYWVCWDKLVLERATKAIPISGETDVATPNTMEGEHAADQPLCSDWMVNAQEQTVNLKESDEVNRLTCKLHGLASNKKGLFVEDEVRSFVDAYAQSLEFEKHGRKIRLPVKMIEKHFTTIWFKYFEDGDKAQAAAVAAAASKRKIRKEASQNAKKKKKAPSKPKAKSRKVASKRKKMQSGGARTRPCPATKKVRAPDRRPALPRDGLDNDCDVEFEDEDENEDTQGSVSDSSDGSSVESIVTGIIDEDMLVRPKQNLLLTPRERNYRSLVPNMRTLRSQKERYTLCEDVEEAVVDLVSDEKACDDPETVQLCPRQNEQEGGQDDCSQSVAMIDDADVVVHHPNASGIAERRDCLQTKTLNEASLTAVTQAESSRHSNRCDVGFHMDLSLLASQKKRKDDGDGDDSTISTLQYNL